MSVTVYQSTRGDVQEDFNLQVESLWSSEAVRTVTPVTFRIPNPYPVLRTKTWPVYTLPIKYAHAQKSVTCAQAFSLSTLDWYYLLT
jgi:hypothetical protein